MHHVVLACPAVVGAAHAALSLVAVCQCQRRCGKRLALGQGVLRVGVIDAGHQVVGLLVLRVNGKAEVAAPAEHSAYGASDVLLWLAVQREHHVGAVEVSVLVAREVVHLEDAGVERLLGDVRLSAPVAVLMAHPHIALAHGQVGTGILQQRDGLLLVVVYHGPCLYHVAVVIGAVAHIHQEVVCLVLHRDGVNGRVGLLGLGVGLVHQLGAHVPVGMAYAQRGCQVVVVQAKGGIGFLPQAEGAVHGFGIGYLLAVVTDV